MARAIPLQERPVLALTGGALTSVVVEESDASIWTMTPAGVGRGGVMGPVTVARSVLLFLLAALAEIGGAWLVWQSVREHRGLAWIGAGVLALGLYGFVATFQPDPHFGRILAAYGGVFVAGSQAWGGSRRRGGEHVWPSAHLTRRATTPHDGVQIRMSASRSSVSALPSGVLCVAARGASHSRFPLRSSHSAARTSFAPRTP